MKKSLISTMLCLAMILSSLFMFACQNEQDPSGSPSDDPSGTQSDPSTESVNVVVDGASEYCIVISDFANDFVKQQAISLRKAIEASTGAKIPMGTDWDNKDSNADIKEILVGKTNREASATIADQLSDGEYSIAVVDNKIVLAGNDQTLGLAVSTFLSTYFGYQSEDNYEHKDTVQLPQNLSFVNSLYSNQKVVLYVANSDLGYVDALEAALKKQWSNLVVASLDTPLADVFSPSDSKLVIVAGINTMPGASKAAIDSYLKQGGRVLMLGGPAFEQTVYEYEGEWYDSESYIENILDSLDDSQYEIILDTWAASLINKLTPSSDNNAVMTKKLGNYIEGNNARQLFHEVENFSSWATFEARVDSLSLKKANLISFYAKPGDDHTPVFSIELQDSKGARWYSPVAFSSMDWTLYTLSPSDFVLFNSGSTNATQPDFTDIVKVKIGFANSHSKTAAGHHSYYISEITMSFVEADFNAGENTSFALNGIAPLYEQYPITNGAAIVTDENQIFVTDRDYVLPETIVSRHPGYTGVGFDDETDIRFIPLLRVNDKKGLHSGYAAWIDLYASTSSYNYELEGAMVGYFGAVSEDFYNADGIAAVVETAAAMTQNAFLVDGGTTEHTYLAEETTDILAGLKYVTYPGASNEGTPIATIALSKDSKLLTEFSTQDFSPVSLKNSIKAIQGNLSLKDGIPTHAVATLTLNGKVIDRLEQKIHFWQAKPMSDRHYIYVEDGYFKRDGDIISFFGVNYAPSSGTATGTNDSGIYRYDPAVVERDLARIKDLGMNAIAVWVDVEDMRDCNNILDLIRQCEEAGLYVDLSIRPNASPFKKYNEQDVETLIQRLHFHENDTIIAYDIAWEPRIGNYDGNWAPGDKHGPGYFIGRQGWDDDFTAWTKLQYGSIAAAEAAWGVKLERTSAGDLLLTDAMLDDTTGKYQKAVAAYYRFVDDIVSQLIQEKMLHMEPLAPNQLISFRMSMSGSALRTSSFKPSTHCFDFHSLASTMDFMEPEGYQLNTTEANALQIMFANAYARYAQPNSPVVWKEFGYSVWADRVDGNFYPNESTLQMAADYYEYALDYMLTSYTSGLFSWYSCAGYRVDEDSDYGIFNPDGSDRPITALLREYAPKFINQGARKDAVLIEIEKDDYIGGIYGMFDDVKDELVQAYEDGKCVTFVNKKQSSDGTYAYADTLLDYAVADAKPENGTYPLRYVNGMIKDFKVVTEGGKTYAEVTVCNTKQSIWREGTVSIVSYDGSDVAVDYTINEQVDYLENVTVKFEISGKGDVALRFEIEDVQFGPLFTKTIE